MKKVIELCAGQRKYQSLGTVFYMFLLKIHLHNTRKGGLQNVGT